MLDAKKNAKSLGYLFFLGALINLFSIITQLDAYANGAIFMTMVGVGLGLITGYGLVKGLKWGVYALGVGAIFQIITMAYNYMQVNTVSPGHWIVLVLQIIIFFWLYSSIKKFS